MSTTGSSLGGRGAIANSVNRDGGQELCTGLDVRS